MAIAYSAAPRFEMGRVVKRTFSVIGQNIVSFALLSLIPALCLAVISSLASQLEEGGDLTAASVTTLVNIGLAGLFYLASALVLQAAVVHGAVVSLNGKRASVGDCLGTGLRNALPLLALGLLAGLGIVAGMILLIVPGLILAVMWAVAAPAYVVERTGVAGAFRRSRELTRGHRWAILGVYVLLVILMVIISIPFGALTAVMAITSAEGGTANSTMLETGAYVINTMITSIIGSAFVAAMYYELRQIKEGIGPEALASVFD